MIYLRMFIVYFVILLVGMYGLLSIPAEVLSYILIFLGSMLFGHWLCILAGYIYDCLYGVEEEV